MYANVLIGPCKMFQWHRSLRIYDYALSTSLTCVHRRQCFGATNAIVYISLHDKSNLPLYRDIFQEKYCVSSCFHLPVNNHSHLLLMV